MSIETTPNLSDEAVQQHAKMTPVFDLITKQQFSLDDESSLAITLLFNIWRRDPGFAMRFFVILGSLFNTIAAARDIKLPEIVVTDLDKQGTN